METKKDIYKRSNRFSGESIQLTKEEAEKHDKIFYHELAATLEDKELGEGSSKHWQKMRDLLQPAKRLVLTVADGYFMKHPRDKQYIKRR